MNGLMRMIWRVLRGGPTDYEIDRAVRHLVEEKHMLMRANGDFDYEIYNSPGHKPADTSKIDAEIERLQKL